jgi:hypothetical protein
MPVQTGDGRTQIFCPGQSAAGSVQALEDELFVAGQVHRRALLDDQLAIFLKT